MDLHPGLYIVATPIGNIKDITLRAIEVLQNSDYIICEDTRCAQKLLTKYSIYAKLIVYNDHSDNSTRQKIANVIQQGKTLALISDAGTPLISDPGYKLVRYLQELNLQIDFLPGACSPIAALCLSGIASDKFAFMGFMPKTDNEKVATFKQMLQSNITTIVFETASRITHTMNIALEVLGNRNAAIVREITKIHQEVIKGNIGTLLNILSNRILKGEIILVFEAMPQINLAEQELLQKFKLLAEEGFSASDCAKIIACLFNIKKTKVYNLIKHEK